MDKASQELIAALNHADVAERRQALSPIIRRGRVRIGLVLLEALLAAILSSRIGFEGGFVISTAITLTIFTILKLLRLA